MGLARIAAVIRPFLRRREGDEQDEDGCCLHAGFRNLSAMRSAERRVSAAKVSVPLVQPAFGQRG